MRTKNRKYVTHSEKMIRNGTTYNLNVKGSGVYSVIIHRAIDQLDICEAKWKRVLVVRFDLHQEFYSPDNKLVSRFMKSLKAHLEREYQIHEPGYVWVRELEKAKSQHYHGYIYLDGNEIRHSSKLLRTMEAIWKNIRATNHMSVVRKPYYFINDEQTKIEAVTRISYLAKARGKGYRDTQTKDYSTSRLINLIPKTSGNLYTRPPPQEFRYSEDMNISSSA